MSPTTHDQKRIVDKQIEVLSNDAFDKGGRWFCYLALFGVVSTVSLHLLEGPGHFEVPIVTCVLLAVMSLIVWRTARAGRLTERRKWLMVVPFALSPHILFYASYLLLPAGTATYLTGPFVQVLVLMVVMTGFMFDARLSMFTGIISGLLYFAAFLLGSEHFAKIDAGDPILTAELQSPAVWAVRATIIGFTGSVVGVWTVIARRLGVSVLRETAEKASISRLFGQYVSDEVKDKLLAEKSGSIGERREVVVLFSDLRGFSTFSEGKEPEEIVEQLNAYFDRMVEAITAHGGVVDKFMGDAVMAVFGGLVELDNPQQAAVDAATAMRIELAALNRRFAERGLEPFDNGIGLHYGVVLQGTIGSSDRKEFTVIGDAVNTAARLESACKDFPESVLLSDTVLAALDAATRARCVDHGAIHVKGKAESVAVHGLADPPDDGDWQSRTLRREEVLAVG